MKRIRYVAPSQPEPGPRRRGTGAVRLLLTPFAAGSAFAAGQESAQDELIFVDGERLLGQFKSATGLGATFTSAMGFEVTTPWAKIKELHTNRQFAVIPTGVELLNRKDEGRVSEGALEIGTDKVIVNALPAQPRSLSPKDISNVVPLRNCIVDWQGTDCFPTGVGQRLLAPQSHRRQRHRRHKRVGPPGANAVRKLVGLA